MSESNTDLIREIEDRSANTYIKDISKTLLNKISDGASDESLKQTLKRLVDQAVRECEK